MSEVLRKIQKQAARQSTAVSGLDIDRIVKNIESTESNWAEQKGGGPAPAPQSPHSIPWNSIKDPGIGLLSTNGDRLIDFHFHSGGIGLIGTQEIVNALPPPKKYGP